jgi:hypothetical protein
MIYVIIVYFPKCTRNFLTMKSIKSIDSGWFSIQIFTTNSQISEVQENDHTLKTYIVHDHVQDATYFVWSSNMHCTKLSTAVVLPLDTEIK